MQRLQTGHTQDSLCSLRTWLPRIQGQITTYPKPTQRLAGLPMRLKYFSCLPLFGNPRQGSITYQEAISLFGCLAFATQFLPSTQYQKRSLTQLMRPLPRSGQPTALSKDLRSLLRVWTFTDALEEVGPLRPLPVVNTIWTDASQHGWGFHDRAGNTRNEQFSNQKTSLHIPALKLLVIKFALAAI